MKVTWKVWLMIISASLLVGGAVGAGVGLASMHPSSGTTSTSSTSKSPHK